MPSIPLFKRCSKCGQEFPATKEYFHRNREAKDGLANSCKDCKRTYNKSYRDSHKEYLKISKKHWQEEHPEMVRASCKRYREKYPEKERERHQKQYQNPVFKEKHKIWVRNWHENNREVVKAKKHHRRALENNATGKFTSKDIQLQYRQQKGKCWWCGKLVDRMWHIDHRVPLSRGGTNDASNLVISCPECNLRKGNKMPHEFNGRLI